MIQGIDVSSVQDGLTAAEWAALKARGIRFAMIKCGNGNNGHDPRFQSNLTGARAAGVVVGCYHVPFPLPATPAHADRDPLAQARAHFAACAGLGSNKGDLPAACDLEYPAPEKWGSPLVNVDGAPVVTRDSVVEFCEAYLTEYERLQGRPMLLYSYPWFLRGLKPPAAWVKHPLWIANYDPRLAPEPPWAGYAMWQTSGGGSMRLPDGAPVDTDAIADEATLAALLGVPPVPSTVPPSAPPTP